MITAFGAFAWHAEASVRVGCAACLVLLGAFVLFRVRPRLRDTTLIAPWTWTLLSVLAVAAVEAVVAVAPTATWVAPARLAAAASTLCPLAALLGAKRPQQLVWQPVVLVLWIVLSMPAAERLLLRPDAPLQLGAFRTLLAAAVLGMGLLNAAGTRFWPATLWLLLAQLALIAPFASWSPVEGESARWFGMAAAAAGLIAARRYGRPCQAAARSFDEVAWRDFRDLYGAFWSAHVAERFNVDAQRRGWSARLSWMGFETADEQAAPTDDGPLDLEPAGRRHLVNLLRRFVSRDWIQERWGT